MPYRLSDGAERASFTHILTAVEIFVGCGGMLIGTAQAGFRHMAAVEMNHACCETLRENQRLGSPYVPRDMEIVEGNVRNVDWQAIREAYPDGIDLLSGGPPCQPFSLGGKAGAYDDERDMFPAYAHVLSILRPRAFVCENVRGLLRPSFSEYYRYILLRLSMPTMEIRDGEAWREHAQRLAERVGTGMKDMTKGDIRKAADTDTVTYSVIPALVDAADYGVPQHRHRVIIVGFRSDVDASSWEFPAPSYSRGGIVNGTRPYRTLAETIDGLPEPMEHDPNPLDIDGHVWHGGARTYPGHTGSVLGEPAKAIKAGVHGVPGGENMIRYPDGHLRHMTVREAARIQTFPDEWHFSGAWGTAMRQIGNAVPCMLAKVVAGSVMTVLRAKEQEHQAAGHQHGNEPS